MNDALQAALWILGMWVALNATALAWLARRVFKRWIRSLVGMRND